MEALIFRYDNHREAILKGGLGNDYKDDSLNILPYFSASCFKGFGDDSKGFYAIYEEVFKKLAAEDSEYMKEDEPDIPTFGKSDSCYEEIVAPFYAYWMYYSTKKTFYWLDPYDTREAPNSKIAKLIEKENKKVRDKAKKERNEEIRNLVAFVRKRDKRVQAWNKMLEEKSKQNVKKVEENRAKQIEERRKQMKDYKESEWLKFSNVENGLKQIEEHLDQVFGENASSEENENFDEKSNSSFFCVACNKVFKTDKAFANHEKSKKHKENIQMLKKTMVEENNALNFPCGTVKQPMMDLSDSENELKIQEISKVQKLKKKKSKQKNLINGIHVFDGSDSDELSSSLDRIMSFQEGKNRHKLKSDSSDEEVEKKIKKKCKKLAKNFDKNIHNCEKIDSQTLENVSNLSNDKNEGQELYSRSKKQTKKNKQSDSTKSKEDLNTDLVCAVCQNKFPSKNKLFIHLKSTGHSIYLPNSASALKEKESKKTKKKDKEK